MSVYVAVKHRNDMQIFNHHNDGFVQRRKQKLKRRSRLRDDDDEIEIDGVVYRVGQLRDELVTTANGDSLAYLTDFLQGCQTIVCENNYRDEDEELARKNYHMTSSDVARIANQVHPRRLLLFHLSDRYTREQWREQLEDVRRQFPETYMPENWL